ncbi:MAG: TIGR04283 family arsenosugar biosynthesis glycosyltransferase [Bacteroidota bacterium]
MMELSIIIPTLNEEQYIGNLLRHLQQYDPTGDVKEIIVVDGQSTDQTVSIARKYGVQVLENVRRGRSHQMNTGAHQAQSNYLLFLHADSIPPKRFIYHLKQLVNDGARAGSFRLRFDQDHSLLNFYSWCTRCNGLPFRFGDQGLFVEQQIFWELGGFDESLMVMEDNKMVDQLTRSVGFHISQAEMLTSARKYRENGLVRLQIIFVLIFLGYYAGMTQERLLNIYHRLVDGVKG